MDKLIPVHGGTMPSELATKIREAIYTALKQHGRYSFFDKGPREVMDTNYLSLQCRAAGVKDTYEAFKELRSVDFQETNLTISHILYHLENWDELWDSYDEVGEWY